MTATADLVIVPANEASWADLQAVFGQRGAAAVCWCQRYKLRPKESFRAMPRGAVGLGCVDIPPPSQTSGPADGSDPPGRHMGRRIVAIEAQTGSIQCAIPIAARQLGEIGSESWASPTSGRRSERDEPKRINARGDR